jgi:hypothetical protein
MDRFTGCMSGCHDGVASHGRCVGVHVNALTPRVRGCRLTGDHGGRSGRPRSLSAVAIGAGRAKAHVTDCVDVPTVALPTVLSLAARR